MARAEECGAPPPYPVRVIDRPLVMPYGIFQLEHAANRIEATHSNETFLTSRFAVQMGMGPRAHLRVAGVSQWLPHVGWLGFVQPGILVSVFDTKEMDWAVGTTILFDPRQSGRGRRAPFVDIDLPFRWAMSENTFVRVGDGVIRVQAYDDKVLLRPRVGVGISSPRRWPVALSAEAQVSMGSVEVGPDRVVASGPDSLAGARLTLSPSWWFELGAFLSQKEQSLQLAIRFDDPRLSGAP